MSAVDVEDVIGIQNAWASAILTMSDVFKANGDHFRVARNAVCDLYAYGNYSVLFRGTDVHGQKFRPTAEDAMAFFVGHQETSNADGHNHGIAINDGRGWRSCVCQNHQIALKGDVAFSIGSYLFTCAATGHTMTMEYTFGLQRCSDGKVRICVHHSSGPRCAELADAHPYDVHIAKKMRRVNAALFASGPCGRELIEGEAAVNASVFEVCPKTPDMALDIAEQNSVLKSVLQDMLGHTPSCMASLKA